MTEKITTSQLPDETDSQVAMNPNRLLQLAVQNNADINNLERLMDLQERWEKKEAEKSFYQAMNDFQAGKPVLLKNSSVDSTSRKSGIRINYSFASLPYIQRVVDPILSNFGLSYSWDQKEEVIDKQSKFTIICVVKHVNGHSEKTELSAFSDMSGSKNAIQGIGSTVSYLKRYTLCNALGLSADDDDDGGGSGTKEEESKKLEGKRWASFQKNFKAGQIPPHALDKTLKMFDLTDDQKDWIDDNRPAMSSEQWELFQKSFEEGETENNIEKYYKLTADQENWIKSKS